MGRNPPAKRAKIKASKKVAFRAAKDLKMAFDCWTQRTQYLPRQ
jgi:nucleoid DNA-binding protein